MCKNEEGLLQGGKFVKDFLASSFLYCDIASYNSKSHVQLEVALTVKGVSELLVVGVVIH